MKINFTKMNGLGNDFVIIDYEEFQKIKLPLDELAKKLCDRKFSIGADGLIIVNPHTKNTDIGWYFYNSDGTTAQMCGNGIRCFAKYVTDKGLLTAKKFTVETLAGTITPEIISEDLIKVNMGNPILTPEKIPFASKNNLNQELVVEDSKYSLNAVSMGNPHCIIFTGGNTKELALKHGSFIETNPIFPEKTNVEFVQVLNRNEIIVDVWERGCGITLACGTGACASVVAGVLNGLLDNSVLVHLPGGDLKIEWNGSKENPAVPVYMFGPATYSFTGQVEL